MDNKLERLLKISTDNCAIWLDDHNAAFIRRGDDGPRIWEINVDTKETKQRTFSDDNVWSVTPHKASGGILYAMDYAGNENYQLYLLPRETDKPIALTNDSNARHMLGGLSEDGKTLVYASNERTPETFDICSLNRETGEKEIIIKMSDHYNWPPYEALSPNGKYVLYNKLLGQSDNALWMADIDNKEAVRVPDDTIVSAETAPAWKNDSSGFFYVSDRDKEFPYIAYYDIASRTNERVFSFDKEIEMLSVSSDDKYLAVTVNEDGYINLKILEIDNRYAPVNCPQFPKGVISYYGSLAWSITGHRLLVSLASGRRPEKIWMLDLDQDALYPLTRTEEDTSGFVEPVLMKYKSFDGLEVPFWLYVPNGREAKNLPVIVEIHGGPEGQEVASFDAVLQYYLSEGIAVAAPNVRGSTGYGKTYTHLDDVEKRLDSVKDIEYLVKYLVDERIADKNKMAVTGMSYGGFMTLSCVTRLPKLWACAVDTVGMYNLETFLENTAEYRRAHRESEYGSLEKHRDILRKVSPIDKIDDIEAPLMVIQGRNDPRVPAEESEQIVENLRKKGHVIEYLCYEDEGHGIVKLKNQLDCYEKKVAFLKKYLNL